ncbi:hypothetical protein [Metabacillus sp. FJAT-52054]|uniref:Uncharacterized protein n=1 Tax=Metabacillus sediminis TaxID=3117746 RepID=A0ABZ2NGJ8_9BACI
MEKSKLKSIGKKVLKIAGAIVVAFILLLIGAAMGETGEKIQLKEGKFNVTELNAEIEKLKGEKKDLSQSVAKIEKDMKSKEAEHEEVVAIIASKEKAQKELDEVDAKLKDTKGALDAELKDGRTKIEAELKKTQVESDEKLSGIQGQIKEAQGELSTAQAEVKTVQSQVDEKKKELASVNGKILKAVGKPKTLGAGQYIVVSDVPAGRYTVTPVGEGSNFFVHGDAGVNTILGRHGEESYTFFTAEGDVIETLAKVKLTPVE